VRTLVVIVTVLLVAALAAPETWAEDKVDIILLKDGTEKKGKVEEENYASVTYSVSGRRAKINASDVKDVLYSDAPQSYRNGVGLMNSKKFKDSSVMAAPGANRITTQSST